MLARFNRFIGVSPFICTIVATTSLDLRGLVAGNTSLFGDSLLGLALGLFLVLLVDPAIALALLTDPREARPAVFLLLGVVAWPFGLVLRRSHVAVFIFHGRIDGILARPHAAREIATLRRRRRTDV